MTTPQRLTALPLLGLLGLTGACRSDCPEGQVPTADPQGTRRVCLPAGDASSSSTGDTTAPTCDDDPACGPDEDVQTCPEQCNVCGDGVVLGAEACDNGDANQSYWSSPPPADACSSTCERALRFCGDAVPDPEEQCDDGNQTPGDGCEPDCSFTPAVCGNAVVEPGEPCDNGQNTDPPHAATPPAADACAPGCTAVRFCGDATHDPEEACDNGDDNQSYWPDTPPDGACSHACDTALEWCGDATQNGPEACDNGQNTDPPYSPAIPLSPTPCAPGCAPARFCGDATHDPDHGEACDDGNNTDGDGCSADCKHAERLVFVSSALLEGDLQKAVNNPQQLTGLALADARCQALAAAAGLPGTFKAWLSDAVAGPATRLDTTFTGLYRLASPARPIVATGWSGLTTLPLQHPIDADETGAPASGKIVWTNTHPDGTPASNLHCNNWSSSKDIDTTTVGSSSKTDPTWTKLGAGQFCAVANRLYCFQDL